MKRKNGKNEGNIYKRRDGRWAGRVRVGSLTGRNRRIVVYGKTRAEAARNLRKVIASAAGGVDLGSARTTVAQFLDRWLTDSAKPRLRPRTFASYQQVIRAHVSPKLGTLSLVRLSPHHVQAWLNELHAGGLSPRTCQYARSILRAALGQAAKWELVSRNVAALVDPPRASRHEIQPLTPEQCHALLAVASTERLGALVTVALALGLRQGEALGLQWSAVDLDNKTLHVRQALQWLTGEGWRLTEPKSERSRRAMTLPDVVVSALRTHRQRQLEARLLAGGRWQEHGFVFTTGVGTPLDPWNTIRAFKRMLKAASLPDVRFHDLRHTAATLLLAQGVDMRTIMETLGHSQISLTLNTYSHVLPALRQDAAERMNAALVDRFARAGNA